MDLEQSRVAFEETQWTLIDALRSGDHPNHEEALNALMARYWSAVYAHIRRSGRDQSAAAELTQAFFVEVVLTRRLFERADRERGRLRALILSALKRFLVDQHRRAAARADHLSITLDDLKREETLLTGDPRSSAEEAFDRRWALSVLEEALARCEEHCLANGQERHWAAFEAHALRPLTSGVTRPSLAELARAFDFVRPEQVSVALRTVRKRLQVILREVVAHTATLPEEQYAEYKHVLSVLG